MRQCPVQLPASWPKPGAPSSSGRSAPWRLTKGIDTHTEASHRKAVAIHIESGPQYEPGHATSTYRSKAAVAAAGAPPPNCELRLQDPIFDVW